MRNGSFCACAVVKVGMLHAMIPRARSAAKGETGKYLNRTRPGVARSCAPQHLNHIIPNMRDFIHCSTSGS
jgi:hypothetical protein